MTAPGRAPGGGVSPVDHLAAARSCRDPAELRRLAAGPYPFVWQALAKNPYTPPDALVALASARSDAWNDHRLLSLLALHPSADPAVPAAVLEAVTGLLAKGARPYAAALALAARPEVEPARAMALGALPGASARLRRGLRGRLGLRGGPVCGPR